MKHDWVVGVQDMGAAGLTSSSFEMAGRAGTGVELDLSRVPLREEGMTPYEILLSESQERMLFVVRQGREQDALDAFGKWDLNAAVIGRVTEGHSVKILHEGKVAAHLPVSAVVDGALAVQRPSQRPPYLDSVTELDLTALQAPERGDEALEKLLASPNIANKRWVYEQYDHMVRLNTLVLPGSDASVIRVPGARKALAISADCNSRYCYLDPYQGAQIAVAECCRNIVCAGGEPIGITNCLNFGSPERPEIMWQFEQAVLGMGDACRFLEIPIVSGNVSFYNETKGEAIFPTPTIAAVGLLEDQKRHCVQWFKKPGDLIALAGFAMEELGGSEYLKVSFGLCRGPVPNLDLLQEKKVQRFCLESIREGLVSSAHDCSEGGLAVALAESCFTGPRPLGARVELESTLRSDALMFGETQSRVLISFPGENRQALEALARKQGVEFSVLGSVEDERLTVRIGGEEYIGQDVRVLKKIWDGSLERYGRQVT